MANLKDIRRRIGSVKGTQKITRAMKMVAAAKLRKAQSRADAFRPYRERMTEILARTAAGAEADAHPLLQRREEKSSLILVISSDRGLCGGFNSNLNRMVARHRQDAAVAPRVAVIGRKAKGYFEHRHVALHQFYPDVLDRLHYGDAVKIARELEAAYTEGEFDRIDLASNRMESMVKQVPVIVPLLPVALPTASDATASTDFLFEPDEAQLLAALLPRYLETQVFGAMLESVAAEHAARMTAMETATGNAQDMIDALTLQYNRARQSAITSELMDIVGGAEALND
jgi:F-type H+-transporting ATPase subunit gamma